MMTEPASWNGRQQSWPLDRRSSFTLMLLHNFPADLRMSKDAEAFYSDGASPARRIPCMTAAEVGICFKMQRREAQKNTGATQSMNEERRNTASETPWVKAIPLVAAIGGVKRKIAATKDSTFRLLDCKRQCRLSAKRHGAGKFLAQEYRRSRRSQKEWLGRRRL